MSKRRSLRQVVDRKRKRSIYQEPDTDEDLDDFRGGIDDDFVPAVQPSGLQSSHRPRRRRQFTSTRPTTVQCSVNVMPSVAATKPSRRRKRQRATEKASSQAEKHRLETTPFAGPSDGKIPDWASLPIDILRDIFVFAWASMNEQTADSTANVKWLMRTAIICRRFAIPALEAFYQSPLLLTSLAPHSLLEILQVPPKRLYMDYKVKVRELVIDVRRLAYSAHNKPPFALDSLARELPRLQSLEILHPVDTPPYRSVKLSRWTYPDNLFSALDECGARLKRWRWNRDMLSPGLADNIYDCMLRIHTRPSFANLKCLVVCGYVVNKSPDRVLPKGVTGAEAPELASAISALPLLEDLTFISCDIIYNQFLEHIPRNLKRLELTNCLEVTSVMLTSYFAVGGSQLQKLTLNHNPALDLAYLQHLESLCPQLQSLSMNLTYYSERVNSNDAWAMYDQLLATDQIPAWPSTLRHLDLIHLQKFDADAAENLFRSLVDSAAKLPDLRYLRLQAHINIPWRDRAGFRDRWIERLQKAYLRRSESPDLSHGSLRQFRLRKQDVARQAVYENTSNGQQHYDMPASNADALLRRSLSHVRVTPRKPPLDAENYAELISSPEKSDKRQTRRSARVESQTASLLAEESADELVESIPEDVTEPFVQGLCDVVDIRIDNQRPRENQYTEANFLDSEPSGDEDWRSGAEQSEEDYAW